MVWFYQAIGSNLKIGKDLDAAVCPRRFYRTRGLTSACMLVFNFYTALFLTHITVNLLTIFKRIQTNVSSMLHHYLWRKCDKNKPGKIRRVITLMHLLCYCAYRFSVYLLPINCSVRSSNTFRSLICS